MEENSNAQATNFDNIDFDNMSAEEFEKFDLDAYLEASTKQETKQVEENEQEPEQEPTVEHEEPNTEEEDLSNDSQEEKDNQDKITFDSIGQIPIRANGHEIYVDTPEKAIQLIQMGANYNKKMQEIKPALGVVQALREAELLDNQEKLNQLIDIAKGDKEALKSFIKQSNLDLSEIDDEEEIQYKPKQHIPSEKEVEFNQVVKELKESGDYETVIQEISKDFMNDKSSEIISENPRLLEALSADIKSGIYNKVMGVVQGKKIFERDTRPTIDLYIESYKVIMNQQQKSINNKKRESVASKVSGTPTRKKATNKQTSKTPDFSNIDFFNMSIEEADKFYNEHLKNLPK